MPITVPVSRVGSFGFSGPFCWVREYVATAFPQLKVKTAFLSLSVVFSATAIKTMSPLFPVFEDGKAQSWLPVSVHPSDEVTVMDIVCS